VTSSNPTHRSIQTRIAAAFGQPYRTFGKDACWELWASPAAAPLNILANGSPQFPVVWVFDPHDAEDGVRHFEIRSDADLNPVIEHVNHRLRHAGRSGVR
jgi:hypothetical protein